MKEEILSLLTMKDILEKYNIKIERTMYHCPFHKDINSSAKIYEKSFYCFSCNRTGDIIQFVEYLYNLTFPQAMEKINQDFNLGLSSNCKINKERIKQIEKERKCKIELKQQYNQKFIDLCNEKDNILAKIRNINSKIKKIGISNIELTFDYECIKSELVNKYCLLDNKIDDEYINKRTY